MIDDRDLKEGDIFYLDGQKCRVDNIWEAGGSKHILWITLWGSRQVGDLVYILKNGSLLRQKPFKRIPVWV